jgi:hypothetical protein
MPGFPTLLAFFRESWQPLAAPALSVCTALPVTIIRVNIPISLTVQLNER